MFFGRETELEYLEELYSRPGLVTCSVLGRRGVGKSSIIAEFCKGKRSLNVQFIDGPYIENQTLLRFGISNLIGESAPEFKTLVEYFEFIGDVCKESKTVIVLDEFPYLVKGYPASASVIQRFLDQTVKDTDVMLILCGSSISVMKNETDSYSRPLYGRIQNRLVVHPLDVKTCIQFHTGMSTRDQLSTYLTVGGIPRYQMKMDLGGYKENVINRFFSEKRDMDEEGPAFIRSQIDNATVHMGIVSCIASGTVRQKEIAEKMGIDPSVCKKALDTLETVDIVKRVHPMLNSPKKPVYYIEDNMVAFHYQVVSLISAAMTPDPEATYGLLKNRIDTFLGLRFELLCRDYLIKNYSVLEIGKWWGSVDKVPVDIDIVAKIIDDNGMVYNLFCECKYSINPVGFSTLNTLMKRVDSLKADNPRLAMFSAGGFDEEVKEWAKENDLLLVDSDMLVSGV